MIGCPIPICNHYSTTAALHSLRMKIYKVPTRSPRSPLVRRRVQTNPISISGPRHAVAICRDRLPIRLPGPHVGAKTGSPTMPQVRPIGAWGGTRPGWVFFAVLSHGVISFAFHLASFFHDIAYTKAVPGCSSKATLFKRSRRPLTCARGEGRANR